MFSLGSICSPLQKHFWESRSSAACGIRIMSPRLQQTKQDGLDSFTPTEEERAAARAKLSKCDQKKKHSQMQSMSNWLKRHPEGSGNAEASSSRGDQRATYLCKYMAWQLRKQSSQTTHAQKTSSTTSHSHEGKPRTEFQLRQELGDTMFEYWQASKLLRLAPNRITGSMDPAVCEWLVCDHEYEQNQ